MATMRLTIRGPAGVDTDSACDAHRKLYKMAQALARRYIAKGYTPSEALEDWLRILGDQEEIDPDLLDIEEGTVTIDFSDPRATFYLLGAALGEFEE